MTGPSDPWIVESALKNRQKHFVVDGEAVVLGVDGRSDFDALHTGKHDEEAQLYAFDMLAMTCGSSRCRCARQISHGYLRGGRMESSLRRLSRARSAPTCSGTPASWGSKAWSPSAAIRLIAQADRRTGSK